MTRRDGGTNVRSGFYWNLASWEMVTVPRQGGLLPGDVAQRYLRVPVPALLVLAPMMGALYAIFLPFIGFAMFFGFLARKAGAGARAGFMELAVMVSPQWAPGQAYLSSKRRARAQAARKQADAAEQARLDALEREIDEK
jgi:hypothetical protein